MTWSPYSKTSAIGARNCRDLSLGALPRVTTRLVPSAVGVAFVDVQRVRHQVRGRHEAVEVRRADEPEPHIERLRRGHRCGGVEDDPPAPTRPGAGDARLDEAPANAAPVRRRRDGQHADPGVPLALELGERPLAGHVGDAAEEPVVVVDGDEHDRVPCPGTDVTQRLLVAR